LISAKRSSQSASWLQVMKAKRPSCSITRSSFSAKPSSSSALTSARSEATSSVLTCSREDDSREGSTASMAFSLSDSAPVGQAIRPQDGRTAQCVALAAHAQALRLIGTVSRVAHGDDESVAIGALGEVEAPADCRQGSDLDVEDVAGLHDDALELVGIGE